MTRTHPAVPFERYADDAICQYRTGSESEALRVALAERFAACGLVLHPQKTKIVYCADTQPQGTLSHSPVRFPRLYIPVAVYGLVQRNLWRLVPARGAPRIAQAMRREVRQWRLQSRTDTALSDLARMVNPYLRGWINYYSHFYKSALHDSLCRIDFR
jgi:RNA-directed DNA polymerase